MIFPRGKNTSVTNINRRWPLIPLWLTHQNDLNNKVRIMNRFKFSCSLPFNDVPNSFCSAVQKIKIFLFCYNKPQKNNETKLFAQIYEWA